MKTKLYFHASQEQFPPEDLLRQAVEAEQAGFDGIATSDHFQPWWEPGESGHTWPWLGACLQATSSVPVGPAVTTPGARYHPALIAQAWMTMERMYPGRTFLGIGSGEALNEVPVGDRWPSVGDQIARMDEALSIIDRLWRGETLSEEGRFFRTQDTKLHTRAERRPPLWVSAFGPQAGRVAGKWGDALWTEADPEMVSEVRKAFVEARDEAGREGDGGLVLQAMFSWAETDEAALEGCRVWKGAASEEFFKDDWHVPAEMYAKGEREVSDEEFFENGIMGADPQRHVAKIRELLELDPDVLILANNSGADPHRAIEVYGEQVLPALRA